MNMNAALTHNTNDDVAANDVREYTLTYMTPFNEIRMIRHLTYSDAMRRRDTLLARGYRVSMQPTFIV